MGARAKSDPNAASRGRLEYLRIAVRSTRKKLKVDPATPRLLLNEAAVGYRLSGSVPHA